MKSNFELTCMQRAVQLANKGAYTTSPNPNVGCVITKDGRVISEGWHYQAGGPHAELMAILNTQKDLSGSTVFVTLEPCAHYGRTDPCVDLLIKKKVQRVFFGSLDPNPLVNGKGAKRLQEHGIEVFEGLCKEQVIEQNKGYFNIYNKKRPWITLKIASTIDGRIAMANGESQWISNDQSRSDAHSHRAMSDALITGVGTIINDDPRFTVRLNDQNIKFKKPHIFILDSQLRTPINAQILKQDHVFLVCTQEAPLSKLNQFKELGCEVIQQPIAERVSLILLMEYLNNQEYNQVQVEAGTAVNGSFIGRGLADELLIYMAPKIMGSSGRSMFQIDEPTAINKLSLFRLLKVKQFGDDACMQLRLRSEDV
jgi:diaminohydroxyphosphoribosylaminopyrimidine deaminase/5-amino-6-(5-phosphoribosylamino)uracil reductase